jgi:sulfoxide reductase heme-binding subunit YedZ
MTDALWYLGRGSGVVALVLLTVSICLGIVVRSRRTFGGLPRHGITLVHRTAAMTATSLIGIHILTLFFDPYAELRLVDLAVPFLGTYRPLWLGFGTLAVEILAAIVITSLVRKRIGHRAFRAVHWATYALWPVAFVHGIGTGTDSHSLWFVVVAVGCAAAVVAAVLWRGSEGFLPQRAHTGMASPVSTTIAENSMVSDARMPSRPSYAPDSTPRSRQQSASVSSDRQRVPNSSSA